MSQTVLRRPYLTSEEEVKCLETLYLPNSDTDTNEAEWLANFSDGLDEYLTGVHAALDDHLRGQRL